MSDLPENVDLEWIGRFLLGMQDRLRTIGDDVAEMKTDLREIRGRVAIRGTLGPEGVARELARADLFALPARDEAFGIAFAEALVHGLPIVACDSGYVPTLVGAAGVFVECGDVEALEWALSLLALDADRREALSQRRQHLRRYVAARAGDQDLPLRHLVSP